MRSLVVGNFIDDIIKKTRGLPSSNPAGSNRMSNIAGAVSIFNNRTLILSSGSAAKIQFNKNWIHPIKIQRKDNTIVIYAPALSIPYLSIFFEPISVSILFIKLYQKYRFEIVFIYCYYPSTILVGLIGRILRLKIVEDLQDIVRPKFSDFKNNGILFAAQQTIGYILMQISLVVSDVILIPTNKFKKALFSNKYLKIDGCFDSNVIAPHFYEIDKINILYSGLINEENGRNLFLNTLNNLNNLPKCNIEFHVSGSVENEEDFKVKLKSFSNLTIKYYGYLDNLKYIELLKSIDVCLVLQNPCGRNSFAKTPSKGFEYMYNGKVVICSNVGDFSEIPDDCILHLIDYDCGALANIILKLPTLDLNVIKFRAVSFAAQHWDFLSVRRKIFNKLKFT